MYETEWRKTLKPMKCDKKKIFLKNPNYVFLGHFWPKLLKWKAKSRLVFMENSLSVEVTFFSLLLLPGVSWRTWQVNAASGPSKWADAFAALSVLHSRGNASAWGSVITEISIHCDSAIFISEIAERDISLEQIHWYP